MSTQAPSGQAINDLSLASRSGKTLRKHIVDFKSLFIQPDCVLKLIGFLSMKKYIPETALNSIALTAQLHRREWELGTCQGAGEEN